MLRPASEDISTPAFIYDERVLRDSLERVHAISTTSGCRLLFAIKSCSLDRAIEVCAETVDGFAISSLFEAKLVREVTGKDTALHITTPAFLPREVSEIADICSDISFNSLQQFYTYGHLKARHAFRSFLRVNPGISLVKDARYDPCGHHSKLGIPLNQLTGDFDASSVDGIHVHTNCDSDAYVGLWDTTQVLAKQIPHVLRKVSSINLGGGYLFSSGADCELFYQSVAYLKDKFGLEVSIEPGAAISRAAGNLVVSVLDILSVDGEEIAVIDGSVNHIPEVFEYQYHHELAEEVAGGPYAYKLAGPTCLAGDHFGIYRFTQPLSVGDVLTFINCGSYALVKAHMFNGINLPSVYVRRKNGDLILWRAFDYEHFRTRWTE